MTHDKSRRGFLGLMAGTAALAPFHVRRQAAWTAAAATEPWLQGLAGQHRQFFDVGSIADGKPLNRVGNFLSAYTSAYALDQGAVNSLFGAHGTGLLFVMSDALWERYPLGELYKVVDPRTNRPAKTNPFERAGASATQVGVNAGCSVAELKERGVRFLACNNSIAAAAKLIAARDAGSAADVHDEIVRGLSSGVFVVPAMLVATNRAQEERFTYAFLS